MHPTPRELELRAIDKLTLYHDLEYNAPMAEFNYEECFLYTDLDTLEWYEYNDLKHKTKKELNAIYRERSIYLGVTPCIEYKSRFDYMNMILKQNEKFWEEKAPLGAFKPEVSYTWASTNRRLQN